MGAEYVYLTDVLMVCVCVYVCVYVYLFLACPSSTHGYLASGGTIEKDGALYSEFYDEIVFRNESAMMNAALHAFAASGSDEIVNGVQDYPEVERQQLESIAAAEEKLGKMIADFKEKHRSLQVLASKRADA